MSNQTTLKFIQLDIAAYEREITQLGDQIKFLTGKREALEFKLKTLKKAVATLGGGKSAITTVIENASPLAGVGFRDALRIILNDATKGLRPRDIASELTRRGFRYEASTDLSTRISNELYRMKKSGHVKKRGNLYYPIKTQEVKDDT